MCVCHSINQFINVKAWDEVALHILARGSRVKCMTNMLNMSGFLHGHSCTCSTALVKIIDDWRLALDSKQVTGSIAVDLSKAFDSICHNLLLTKLRAYGISGEATEFFLSHLCMQIYACIF